MRDIRIQREKLPLEDLPQATQAATEPAGFGLLVLTQGPGGVFTKSGALPKDLRNVSTCEVWVHRSPAEARSRPSSQVDSVFTKVTPASGARSN